MSTVYLHFQGWQRAVCAASAHFKMALFMCNNFTIYCSSNENKYELVKLCKKFHEIPAVFHKINVLLNL